MRALIKYLLIMLSFGLATSSYALEDSLGNPIKQNAEKASKPSFYNFNQGNRGHYKKVDSLSGGDYYFYQERSYPDFAPRVREQYTAPSRSAPAAIEPPNQITANGVSTFIFNPNDLNWGAYDENGSLVNYGRASGGRSYCADVGRKCKTPAGSFSVYRKGSEDCKSSIYPLGRGGAPMQYCMFFSGGYAIHGSNDVPNHNASHGCIRVVPSAAKWLNEQFIRIGTKVIIHAY